jgi:hypothetical protein
VLVAGTSFLSMLTTAVIVLNFQEFRVFKPLYAYYSPAIVRQIVQIYDVVLYVGYLVVPT